MHGDSTRHGVDKEDYLSLKKAIYGLAQSTRQFYMKSVEGIKSSHSVGSQVSPCLWISQTSLGIVLMALYVNDCLTVRVDVAIQEVIKSLQSFDFVLNVKDELTDFSYCMIIHESDRGKAWIV